jgi:hypothetical protein
MVSDGVRQEFANIFRYPMARILSMARIMSTAGIHGNAKKISHKLYGKHSHDAVLLLFHGLL